MYSSTLQSLRNIFKQYFVWYYDQEELLETCAKFPGALVDPHNTRQLTPLAQVCEAMSINISTSLKVSSCEVLQIRGVSMKNVST